MATQKSALGKGLSALLDGSDSDIPSRSNISSAPLAGSMDTVAIGQIEANPFQPRTKFDQEKLDELAASITQLGIIQPLTVRKLGFNKYQLISGERRFRASQLAGLTQVPVYVRIANDQAMLEMALVENIQRHNLNAIEVAISYQRLINECNLTQEALGERVGKKRSTVTNYLRLLKLPPQIQKALTDRLISMGHARAIIALETEEEQLKSFQNVVNDSLSVRETEAAIQKRKETDLRRPKKELSHELERMRNYVSDQLNAGVGIKVNAKGKGEISIAFDNETDLKRVLSVLDLLP